MVHQIKEEVWHVIGKTIEKGATSAEAILQAGLDFEVMKRPNLYALPSGNNIISDNSFFTFRTDTEAILGYKIGKDYQVVQNISELAAKQITVEFNPLVCSLKRGGNNTAYCKAINGSINTIFNYFFSSSHSL